MPGIDWELLSIVVARAALPVTTFAAFMSGFSIRHAIRAAGWPPWSVRLATGLTWAVAVLVVSRVVFVAPLTSDVGRAVYRLVLLAGLAALVFYGIGLGPTRRWIERRPSRRVRLFVELQAIGNALPSVETIDDREHLKGLLADLDRYLEPATFEYIHTVRSQVAAWLNGGEPDLRWTVRLERIASSVRPASWSQDDALSRFGQRIRTLALRSGPVLAAVSGFVLGWSVMIGPTVIEMPAAIVSGYLLTWRWAPAAAPLLASAAVGLGSSAWFRQPALPGSALATAAVVVAALLGWAALEWRMARGRPALRLLGPSEAHTTRPPRAN